MSVQVSEDTEYSSGTANLTLSNPYMTETLFEAMAQRLTGYAYRPATLPVSMGDPRLEAGDVISVTDTDENNYTVPCLSLVHSYDGGFMTTVSAPGESETKQSADFTGSLTQAAERTATKLATVQELVATKAKS